MKREYQKPTLMWDCMEAIAPMLVAASWAQGDLSDGTHIGDGGDDDDDVTPYVKGEYQGFLWDDMYMLRMSSGRRK